MDVITRALAAHQRLMSSLPVRTHVGRQHTADTEKTLAGRRHRHLATWRRKNIERMLLEGATWNKIRTELHVGGGVIQKIAEELKANGCKLERSKR